MHFICLYDYITMHGAKNIKKLT